MRKTKHHLYFPRKKYPGKEYRSKFVYLDDKLHKEFHEFFDHNCRHGERECWPDGDHCKFGHICCYYRTKI